jgi:hypothetical protein
MANNENHRETGATKYPAKKSTDARIEDASERHIGQHARPLDERRTAWLRCCQSIGVFEGCVRRLHRFYLPLAMLALAACSSSDPVEQQSKTASSAGQTAAMILTSWVAGAAPSDYASATLRSTAETLAAAGRQIQSDNSPESPERRGVMTAIGRLSAAVRRAQAGVEAGNPRQVSQARQELRTAATDLAAAIAKYVAPKS